MLSTNLISSAGVGYKPDYFDEVKLYDKGDLWLEVHTENYLTNGGPRIEQLTALEENFDLSFHGVSASLGSGKSIDKSFISNVKALIDRFQPKSVSEHAVWCRNGHNYMPDLLPLPRTTEVMNKLIDGVDAYQNGINRQILLENPTNYLQFKSEMDEPDFLIEVAQRTGCGLLLDLNNLYISSINCGTDAHEYIDALPLGLIGEIHIAGFDVDPKYGGQLLIDSHAAPVSDAVWNLLEHTIKKIGPTPVLVERDDQLPPWSELLSEHSKAQKIISSETELTND